MPSRAPDFAADLLIDLKQTEPDFEITEFVPPEPVGGMRPIDPDEFTIQDPVIYAPEEASDESTLRIDMVVPPPLPQMRTGIPPATTLVDPPRPGSIPRTIPRDEGWGGVPDVGQDMRERSSAEANARAVPVIPTSARPRAASPASISGRSTPASPSAPRLTLPCAVVVIDDDRRAGAQTGSRLMEAGCTCRAITLEDAAGVLDHSVQVVLLELPAAEVRTDGGRARIDRIAPYKGPLVLTSAAVIDPLPDAAGAAVTKPYFIEDLIAAIEAARRKPPSRSGSRGVAILDPVEAIAHHDLDANVVRALLVRADGSVNRGRVRTMSYDGELLVAMNQPPRRGIEVGVELTLADGRRFEIPGKVGQSTGSDMELGLKMGEPERLFVRAFLDQARDVSAPFVEQVRIRQVQPISTSVVDDVQLDRLWQEAASSLDDDALQQRFIQSCLKAQKLEHAVKCYRQLKQELPGDERVAKYLLQVGTILGFYALKKEAPVKDDHKLPLAVKIALGVFVGAALILWVMLAVMR